MNYLEDIYGVWDEELDYSQVGAELRDKAQKYKLKAPAAFWTCDPADIGRAYNGAGPDRWPEWKRKICSFVMRLYDPAVAVHDYEFENSDGTENGFDGANTRFHENMRRIRAIEYPWWNLALYPVCSWWWTKAQAAYRACVEFGWTGWVEQAPKNKQSGNAGQFSA